MNHVVGRERGSWPADPVQALARPYPRDGDSISLRVQHIWRQQHTVNEVQDTVHCLVVTAYHPSKVIEVNAALWEEHGCIGPKLRLNKVDQQGA